MGLGPLIAPRHGRFLLVNGTVSLESGRTVLCDELKAGVAFFLEDNEGSGNPPLFFNHIQVIASTHCIIEVLLQNGVIWWPSWIVFIVSFKIPFSKGLN